MSAGEDLKNIVEAALLAAGKTLTLEQLQDLFEEQDQPDRKSLRAALETLNADYQGRGIEVREVSSGWRIQVRKDYALWVSRLWDEKPGRYSRPLMETLALIAYRQPVTRGEIEDIRGVSVSTHITKSLLEREWIRVVGHRDVPGKPALYGTTREFLDYFDLKSLDELPSLAELRDLDEINRELNLVDPDQPPSDTAEVAPEGETANEDAMVEAETGQVEPVDGVPEAVSTGTAPEGVDVSDREPADQDLASEDLKHQDSSDQGHTDQEKVSSVPESSDGTVESIHAAEAESSLESAQQSTPEIEPDEGEQSDAPTPDEAGALEEPNRHG